jgi:hypothetical protein
MPGRGRIQVWRLETISRPLVSTGNRPARIIPRLNDMAGIALPQSDPARVPLAPGEMTRGLENIAEDGLWRLVRRMDFGRATKRKLWPASSWWGEVRCADRCA